MVAGAIGAPPKLPTRQAAAWLSAKLGSSRHKLYIAGTISECVMPSRAARPKKSRALKAGITIKAAAARVIAAISAITPVTWLSGTAASARSLALRPMQAS